MRAQFSTWWMWSACRTSTGLPAVIRLMSLRTTEVRLQIKRSASRRPLKLWGWTRLPRKCWSRAQGQEQCPGESWHEKGQWSPSKEQNRNKEGGKENGEAGITDAGEDTVGSGCQRCWVEDRSRAVSRTGLHWFSQNWHWQGLWWVQMKGNRRDRSTSTTGWRKKTAAIDHLFTHLHQERK